MLGSILLDFLCQRAYEGCRGGIVYADAGRVSGVEAAAREYACLVLLGAPYPLRCAAFRYAFHKHLEFLADVAAVGFQRKFIL